jgi:hypothetical protein
MHFFVKIALFFAKITFSNKLCSNNFLKILEHCFERNF